MSAVHGVLIGFAVVSGAFAETNLLDAIQQSNLSAIKKSIGVGADVNGKDRSGATPLMYAALYSNAECMRLLLAKGAAVNAANSAGATALIWAAGDPEKVRLLVANGADVNAQSSGGRTPLMVAAAIAGNIEAVKLLLSKGANVKTVSPISGGAVSSAAGAGDETMLRALLSAGGDPNERDRLGQTPLMRATYFGRMEPVKVLLDAGANVNDHSSRRPPVKIGLQELGELSALLIATPTGNAKLVELLLDRGANVNAKDMRGMTPLMMAAASEFQDPATVRVLMSRGGDVNAKATDGQTAVEWARKFGRNGVVKFVETSASKPAEMLEVKAGAAPESSIRTAAEKALKLLQSSSTTYFKNSGCVGCHHQALTGMAVGLARGRGLQVDESLAKEQLHASVAVRMPEREGLLQGVSRGGAPMTDTMLLMGLDQQKHPADSLTIALVHAVAGMQGTDGSWSGHNLRPPLEYSPFTETAYAIRALRAYAPEGRRAELERRVDRARAWLLAQKPIHNEERVKHLLGLAWAGVKPQQTRAAAARLLSEQLPDGGWAQREGLRSDAYATGQTLFALNQAAGIRPDDPAFRKGIDFLRKTQLADGSWHVKSRSVKFQPYFDGGFPHEHDQWISAAGSAWAAMALTLAAEAPAVASR